MESIWKQDYELMKELKELSTTYVTFIQNGGHIGTFPSTLINKTVSICLKLKENRDFKAEQLNEYIMSEAEECKQAVNIISGNHKDSRIDNLLYKIYSKEPHLQPYGKGV